MAIRRLKNSMFTIWWIYISKVFTKLAIYTQAVSWSHKQTRNLKEENQPSMCDKAGSRLRAIRMNWQDFSGLTNEIPDWTAQSDRSLLCWSSKWSYVGQRYSSPTQRSELRAWRVITFSSNYASVFLSLCINFCFWPFFAVGLMATIITLGLLFLISLVVNIIFFK